MSDIKQGLFVRLKEPVKKDIKIVFTYENNNGETVNIEIDNETRILSQELIVELTGEQQKLAEDVMHVV